MEQSLHYGLLAAHILFQKAFWAKVLKDYPALLPGQPKVLDYIMAHESSFQREIADGCLIEAPHSLPDSGQNGTQWLDLPQKTKQ